jgi:hypothetical protein
MNSARVYIKQTIVPNTVAMYDVDEGQWYFRNELTKSNVPCTEADVLLVLLEY